VRDYLVLAIVFISAPIALVSPYYGVLMWSWLAYFNPHRYAWGVAHDFPVAIIIAVPTLIGTIFAAKNRNFLTRESLVLCMLWAWFVVTTINLLMTPAFAGHAAEAKEHLGIVSKILLMTFVTILLVISREKLRMLVLVIIASFGVRAVVAAAFFIATGGQYKIWGPEGTFLADNNDFALGLNMTIPMFVYFARSEPRRWLRVIVYIMLVCVVISVIGTYSRGGLIGLSVVILALMLKSRRKAVSILLVAFGAFCLLTFATLQWKERMGDFLHGDLDESAESRLAVWQAGWNLARAYPLTGGGFDVYTDPNIIVRYLPSDRPDALLHGPHSIYFQMLGEQGFAGLGLFLMLLGGCYLRLRKLRRAAAQREELSWIAPYASMFEISLLAYMFNGATLGRAYFDYFFEIVACVVVLDLLFRRALLEVWSQSQSAVSIDTASDLTPALT
jgi:probable O-glycosylation ligase (exosortase A-associated)